MIERIKSIIHEKGLPVSVFADKIGINTVTLNQQILGERKLSLAVVTAVLTSFPEISADWLLRGTGGMFTSEPDRNSDDLLVIDELTKKVERLERENALLSDRVSWLTDYNRELILEIGDRLQESKKAIS